MVKECTQMEDAVGGIDYEELLINSDIHLISSYSRYYGIVKCLNLELY